MYEDDPDWRALFNLLEALYEKNPVRTDIAGTVESISHITAELLYRCYHAFYNPANMALCICGDFDPQAAADFIDSRIRAVEPKPVETARFDEPETAVKKEARQKLPVSIPMFRLGYKDTLLPPGPAAARRQLTSEILLEMLFGRASDLYCALYDEGLVNSSFSAEYFCGRGFAAAILGGESRAPETVAQRIRAAIADTLRDGIDEKKFERARRKIYGQMVAGFDSVDDLANYAISCAFEDVDVFTQIDAVQRITADEAETRLRELFREEAAALSLIEPA